MSKKHSKPTNEQSVRVSLEDLFAAYDRIDMAIEKVTEWPAKCPGPCFPIVHRAWMGHIAFQVA
jgi:hypothetical protein